MKILGRQVVAARGLLAWTQGQLAAAADVDEDTIVSWERGTRDPRAQTVEKVRRAVEKHGVEFTNGNNPGVRFMSMPVGKEPSP